MRLDKCRAQKGRCDGGGHDVGEKRVGIEKFTSSQGGEEQPLQQLINGIQASLGGR